MPAGHAVVDGSNIATEGRSEPSLAQLNEAVAAFRDETDFEHVTVIVDASFEHRVNEGERDKARAAIDANEIITPPAGVIGRGDTFILQVAERANAVVLSNDSFQEFHGTYTWLFDEGRLIGGKPVPGIGWIYVPRSPVRGPVSREATRPKTNDPKPAAKKATKKPAAKKIAKKPVAKKIAKQASKKRVAKKASAAPAGNNTVRAWNSFRRQHPVGTSVRATVESFSSHGAYAKADGIAIYLPLSLMADPAPRRPRDAVNLGETRQLLIHRYDEERRGIDASLVTMDGPPVVEAAVAPPQKAVTKKAVAKKAATKKQASKKASVAKKRSPRRR